MAVPLFLFLMKILSLFANVGFGEFYFKQNGFEVVVANELLEDRVAFYRDFYSDQTDVICGDICEKNVRDKIIQSCRKSGPIDIIIATPPCQGMSIANAQRSPNDIRNKLIIYAMELFNELSPKYMMIENVPAMLNTYINYEGEAVRIIDFINQTIPHDYSCNSKVLNGKHFGTAQSRSRSICLISQDGLWDHPKAEDYVLTLEDVIGDTEEFPSLESEVHSKIPWHFASKHNSNHIEWMQNTPEGETAFNNSIHFPHVIEDGNKRMISGFKTTYKRMSWNEPAPTVTMTNGSISSQNNVHPGHKLSDGTQSDARVLSIREILAVCGLPTDCLDKFCSFNKDGTYQYKYKPNFIRKVLGELFLPKMALSMLMSIPEEPKPEQVKHTQLEFNYE
jgi:DNA (cytosine-5)-methyltransferase 1